MKELRKRINGLIAILLAVCLVMEMTGVQVCATEYTFGDYRCRFNCDTIKDWVLYPGDTLKWGDSGGYFIVTYPEADSENSIGSYIIPDPYDNDSYTCNESLLVNSSIPGMYDGIKITDAISTPDNGPDGKTIKKLTLGWCQQYLRYNLHFETNGGTAVVETLADLENCKFNSGDTYGLYNGSTKLTRPGYSFLGWDYDQNATSPAYTADSSYTLPDSTYSTITNGQTINLYAIWKAIAYKATFAPGSVGTDIPSGTDMSPIEGNVENQVTLPACTYSLPNYHFVGWKLQSVTNDSTNTSVGQVFSSESIMNYVPSVENCVMNFEAQWEPNAVMVSYDANGGEGSIAGSTYTYGSSPSSISLPVVSGSMTKSNYHFKGWCKDADGSSAIMSEGASYSLDYSNHNQTITLYAIWEPNAYSIRFNGNGGTGEMANQAGISSEPTILNANQFTSIDQMFAGWSTTGNGTVQYADRASFDFQASTNNQVVDLYAIWKEIANNEDRIQVGVGTIYLTTGQAYSFGENGAYQVDGDPTVYSTNTLFYVPVSGYYTISAQ